MLIMANTTPKWRRAGRGPMTSISAKCVKLKKVFTVREALIKTAHDGTSVLVVRTFTKAQPITVFAPSLHNQNGMIKTRHLSHSEKDNLIRLKNPNYELLIIRGEDSENTYVYEFRGELYRRVSRAFMTGSKSITARHQAWGCGYTKMALVKWAGTGLVEYPPDPILIGD